MEVAPAYCSACFQQQPDVPHVDLNAAWEGPVLDVSGTKHTIDDLMLCENCIRQAADQLPEALDLKREYDQLNVRYERVVEYSHRLQAAVATLERAMSVQPEESKVEQPKPRRKAAA